MTTAWERAGRPKPPGIRDGAGRIQYEEKYYIAVVYKHISSGLWAYAPPGSDSDKTFPTHAEAIQHAQQLARKDTL